MTAGPAISIVMPIFNCGKYLAPAVESAASQLGPDDELLVQDGGSTDGSIELVTAAYESDPRVKVVSGPDGGQADALNLGLSRAVNPVIGWLNGDDCYYPGALDAARQGWIENPSADLVYGGWTLYSEEGAILRVCEPKQLTHSGLMRTPQIFTGAMFMSASMLREIGGFDRNLHFCMDMDVVARILGHGQVPVLVPGILGGFLWQEGTKSGSFLDFGPVREGFLVRRRYAKGLADNIDAFVFTATQAIFHVGLPIRRSKLLARLRVKGAKGERAASLSESSIHTRG